MFLIFQYIRILGSLLLVFIICQQSAKAQSRLEIFGGYSYLRTDQMGSPTNLRVNSADMHGWDASLKFNLNPIVGVLSSFSGQYGGFTGNLGRIAGSAKDTSRYTFLFGPEFAPVRRQRLTVNLHALGGVIRTNATVLQLEEPFSQDDSLVGPPLPPLTGITFPTDTTAAFAIGGSLDVHLTDRLSYRIVEPQLLRTFSPNRYFARVSTGLVFHFGRIR